MSEPFDYELPGNLATPLYKLMAPGRHTAFAAARSQHESPITASAAWVATTVRSPATRELQVMAFHVEYSGSDPVLVAEYQVLGHQGDNTFKLMRGRTIPNDSGLAKYLVTYAIRVALL